MCNEGHSFSVNEGVPDLTWPLQLEPRDAEARRTYDGLVGEYEKYAGIAFETFKADEDSIRKDMTDRLNLRKDSIVLETGAGDGRGSVYIAERLGKEGKFFVQELAGDFLKDAYGRLKKYEDIIEYSVANGSYLPFPDNYFDAAHHFGGISTFADVKRSLSEMCRVVKPGGKILVGDESMGEWLRDTEFAKIMTNSNPLYKYEIPFKDIPVEARDVKVEWIMMGAFFLLEFTVGEGLPEANYHVPIPSGRGGSHWVRYYGNLEGVRDDIKELAQQARTKSGMSMHEWMNMVVEQAARRQLRSEKTILLSRPVYKLRNEKN